MVASYRSLLERFSPYQAKAKLLVSGLIWALQTTGIPICTFWVGFGETATSYEDQIFHFSVSMFNTGFFWIYLLLIIGLFYGYYRGYGDQYPHLYLVVGMAMFLMTSCADRYQPVESLLGYSYGFILELIGSFAIATGGYFYYITKTGLNKISNKGG